MADTKQQWYKDAKYGLFIHWGLYSILAGEWKDPKTGEVTKTDRIAEWIENNLNIDKEDYRKLKDEFHPDKFDADMFVKRAKEQWVLNISFLLPSITRDSQCTIPRSVILM